MYKIENFKLDEFKKCIEFGLKTYRTKKNFFMIV